MTIAILGAGTVGSNLARALAARGHRVALGVREPAKLTELLEACDGLATAGSPRDAAAPADIVFLAVPYAAVASALAAAGSLDGKILVDCTNPLAWTDGPGIIGGLSPSGAAAVARLAPGARVVKALNTHGGELNLAPSVAGRPLTSLMAGDDADAKAAVGALLGELGFDAVDAGPLRHAEHLEHLAVLWIHLALRAGLGRSIGFHLLRDEA